MKRLTLQAIALLFFTLVLPHTAMAGYGAVAISDKEDDKWAWAVRPTQKEAERMAMKLCNESASKKDCALWRIKAIAEVTDKGSHTFVFSRDSAADAKRKARAACGAACKVEVMTNPGFYSYAEAEKDGNGQTYGYLAYGIEASDQADKTALAGCSRKGGKNCAITRWGVIPGRIQTAQAPAPALTAKPGNCRPTTAHLRCESQCTNGACVITYENGCRMQVQVQPRFDGFTNQWVYPTPSC